MAGTLLAHLYSRINGSQEDVATAALQYIISSSSELNRAFNKLLSDTAKIDFDPDTRYSLQSVGKNKERPDMSGADSSGNEIILCEMKFYAGLTSNQPNAYLDRLKDEEGKALVFVCPEQRKVYLWDEIKNRCRKEGKTLTDEDGYRVTVDGVAMALVTWAQVIEGLQRVASSVAVESLFDISELEGFCEMMDSTAFIPFRAEDLSPDVQRSEERYFQVIDRLCEMLKANKAINADTKNLRATPTRTGYNRYIWINDHGSGLVFDRKAWMNKSSAETPFWFYFCDGKDCYIQSEDLKTKLKKLPAYEIEYFGNDNKIAVALYAPVNAQLDEIAESLMAQIIDYMKKIEA